MAKDKDDKRTDDKQAVAASQDKSNDFRDNQQNAGKPGMAALNPTPIQQAEKAKDDKKATDLKEQLTGPQIGQPQVKSVEQMKAEADAANKHAGQTMDPADLDIIADNTPPHKQAAGKTLFEIAFQNCPTLRVVAADVGQAWLRYKRHCGIRAAVANKPTILDLGAAKDTDRGDVPEDAGSNVPPYCRI